jgi:hypothetical protein
MHSDIKEPLTHVFAYGSHIYGTNTEKSDEDFIVIVRSDEIVDYGIHEDNRNIFVHSDTLFQQMIDDHKVQALECIFSHPHSFTFTLNPEKLRSSFSAVVSNAMSKARKKLKPGEHFNSYIAKKSLFHGIRILDYGCQIAEHGKIINFQSANNHFHNIFSIDSDDFNVFWAIYEPIGQELKSRFKVLAPLEKDSVERKW